MSQSRTEWGLLLGRIILGIIMLAHGLQKMSALGQVAKMFAGQMGLPGPLAYVVAVVETVAGLLLILGLWVEIAAVAVGLVMVGAIATVKWKAGFFGGYELDLALLGFSLVLTLSGSRKWALSGLWSKKVSSDTDTPIAG
ncbi:DoxX family protein [Polycladomyces subterraneus]|uniref:DoxX family protein n=1 Tax=Polycladomyces subterraneus TaxID=1016997 RepID=A0ABT8IQU6_9BACL|nr:DoxX family protein [Polycladomyces subterraneus]MDN4595179.1 DoxX family protein [Polycladomyces subterraneus]